MQEWQIIIAVLVAIPFIMFPIAFIWYMNVSGLYQVMRESRQRRKRRAQALKEAEQLVLR